MRRVWVGAMAVGLACGPESDDAASDGASTGSCELDGLVDDVVEESVQPPLDCGFVGYMDTLAAWQAAHDCALAAFEESSAVRLRWQPTVIDGVAENALTGTVDGAYAITLITWDDYMGDTHAASWPCADVEPYDECVVAVGEMCLECLRPGDTTVLCE